MILDAIGQKLQGGWDQLGVGDLSLHAIKLHYSLSKPNMGSRKALDELEVTWTN